MQFMFDAARADPVILWTSRALFVALAAYIAWALYAGRNNIGAFLGGAIDATRRAGAAIWTQWGGLLKSRSIIGGLVMYLTLQAQLNLPPEALNAITELALVGVATLGLLFSFVGRLFASGPIHLLKAQPASGPYEGLGGDALNPDFWGDLNRHVDEDVSARGLAQFGNAAPDSNIPTVTGLNERLASPSITAKKRAPVKRARSRRA